MRCCFSLLLSLFWLSPGFAQDPVTEIRVTQQQAGEAFQLLIQTVPAVEGTYPIQVNDAADSVVIKNGRGSLALDKFRELVYVNIQINGASIHRFYRFENSSEGMQKTSIPLWLSILPPLVAILLALVFKEVIISLFTGIWLGAFIAHGLSFSLLLKSLLKVIDTYIVQALTDSGHISIIVFSLLIGGMVAIISRNGGMAGIVAKLSKYANSAKNSQLITWLLGIAIFFDDYANTLIVGNTMRPVTDRFRISREKLAYIVDSTAAPIAAVAFISTWIGAELGYISDASKDLGIQQGAYSMFFHSLQYSFYPILTLAFIYFLIIQQRDFGPMLKAELRARSTGKVSDGDPQANDPSGVLHRLDPVKGKAQHWYNAFVPVLVVITVTIIGLVYTGLQAEPWDDGEGFLANISVVIGNSDSYVALLWSSLSGVIVATLMTVSARIMPLTHTMETMLEGIKAMIPAIAILILAWSLAAVTDDLHTAKFLASISEGNISAIWLPLITFILAALISFSTGSSWGTMAMLYPLILPTTWALLQSEGIAGPEGMEIFYNVIAVVLAGSVLGDHCSPISDTTILSSMASGCHHIDHVSTQLPYALSVGTVSVLLGGLFVHVGLPFYVNYAIGIALVYGIARYVGRRVS